MKKQSYFSEHQKIPVTSFPTFRTRNTMSEEIPYTKRYIYNLDTELLNSLETLYFDSLTFEQRSHKEFIERRKDEIDTDYKQQDVSVSRPVIIQPKPRLSTLSDTVAKLNISKPQTEKPTTGTTEDNHSTDSELSGIEESSTSESEQEQEQEQEKEQEADHATKESQNYDYESTVSFMATKSPMILFNSRLLNTGKCFGLYKTTIDAKDSPNFDPLHHLRSISFSSANPIPKDPIEAGMSAIFMLSSGHFAGAIISHLPHSTKGNRGTISELQLQSVRLLTHKTFHRYTTRRKQGGSQSAMDDSKGKANSAGSTLRRYNEQALGKDVENLLEEWKPLLEQCSSIFVRGSGKGGKNARGTGLIVRDPKDPKAIIKTGDKRVKYLPFATKRPTTNELKSAWIELSYLKIVDLPSTEKSEIERRKKREELLNKSKEIHTNKEDTDKDKNIKNIKITDELLSLLKKSKAPALISFMRKNKIAADFRLQPEENYRNTPTALHYASKNGLSFMVQTLLVQLHANPSILNEFGKTAYEISNDEVTKLSFRLSRGIVGEDNDAWKDSKVESAMSREEVEKAKEEIKLRNKELESSQNEELKQQHHLLVEQFKNENKGKNSTGKTLGNGPGITRVTEEQKLSGLSDAQRMKVLREQRYRAIEARLNKQKNES